jgi:alkanesulfonate monooxygenase SsuD/methylene tetrahydromethanopterin reductase-like flavin-dependent oxidoreductase (luciferase family)
MTRIGAERGWPPTQRQDFDALGTRRGALFLGGVDEVVEKILFQHELFGHDRFLMQTSLGPMPHDKVLRSYELLGEVRERVLRTIS